MSTGKQQLLTDRLLKISSALHMLFISQGSLIMVIEYVWSEYKLIAYYHKNENYQLVSLKTNKGWLPKLGRRLENTALLTV